MFLMSFRSVYLGAVIHSTTQSTPGILHCSALTHRAMQSLDKQLLVARSLSLNEI